MKEKTKIWMKRMAIRCSFLKREISGKLLKAQNTHGCKRPCPMYQYHQNRYFWLERYEEAKPLLDPWRLANIDEDNTSHCFVNYLPWKHLNLLSDLPTLLKSVSSLVSMETINHIYFCCSSDNLDRLLW